MKPGNQWPDAHLPESVRYLRMGPFFVDLQTQITTLNERPIPVPPCTFNYLVALMRHSPNPVSYQELVAEAQGNKLSKLEAQDLARWRVYMLRKAIEPDVDRPRYVISVAGVGYRLSTEEKPIISACD